MPIIKIEISPETAEKNTGIPISKIQSLLVILFFESLRKVKPPAKPEINIKTATTPRTGVFIKSKISILFEEI